MNHWRSHLARSLHQHRNQPEARFFHLATVDAEQRPHNRTVVFRGFLENSDRYIDCLKIVTDRRSQKYDQIAANPYAEVSWYFPKTRSQFRILGRLILIDGDAADPELQNFRQAAWQALSDAARSQFAWDTPRSLRPDAKSITEVAIVDPLQPLDWFCLLLLEPTQVDRLELRGTPQNRWLYHKTPTGWTEQEVNP
jgi:pyridoxamine 5'-phosphate oxidase